MALLSSLLSAIAAIPKLIDAINALLLGLKEHEKALENARIDHAQSAMHAAKSDEERAEAEKEMADALRHL